MATGNSRSNPSPLLLLVLFLACASPPGPGEPALLQVPEPGEAVPWTGLEAARAPGHFKFLVVTDRTGEHRDGVFEAAIDKINLLRPAFVVSVGDLIEGYTADPALLDAQWREVDGFVERLGMPFFYAAGNHDFSNEAMSRDWRARRGPSYYHFRYEDVLFLVLNSELFPGVAQSEGAIPGPDTQADQLDYAEQVLADHADARWTFVVIHRPLWDRREVHPDWLAIEAWLGDRPYTVFAGHLHKYTSHLRHDRRYLTLATTGGVSRMRGLDRGEFDHVALVSVGDGEPVIANLLLDGIHDADVRTADTRARLRQLEKAVRSEPLVVEGSRFERGSARFVVVNEGSEAMQVRAQPREGRDLIPGADVLEREIAPGARETFELPFRARRPEPIAALAPATVEWTLRTPKADGSPLTLEQTSWLLPETRFECPRAPGAVRVDGRLDEWDLLPFEIDARPTEPDAPRGASARFGVAWDDDFLYVAARVVDPSPVFDAGRSARDQDAIHVVLDARPSPARDANHGIFRARSNGSLAQMVLAWLVPGETRKDRVVDAFAADLPPGTRRAARTSALGYAVELAIPRAFLDERQGMPWQSFRLNVSLQDFTDESAAHVTHWWRPSRFGMSGVTPIAGAGSFWKSD